MIDRETLNELILFYLMIAKPSLSDILLLISLILREAFIRSRQIVARLYLGGLRTKYLKDVWPIFKIRGSVNSEIHSPVLTATYVVASQKNFANIRAVFPRDCNTRDRGIGNKSAREKLSRSSFLAHRVNAR